MFVIGIDPGTTKSAVVVLSNDGKVTEHFIMPNDDVIITLRNMPSGRLTVIEMVENQGRQAVGKDTFETCVWIGRFIESRRKCKPPVRIGRRDIKLAVTGSSRSKDSDIRTAIIDMYGGKEKAIGNKAYPGLLYGIKSHEWQALAAAIAYFLSVDPMWKVA